MIEGNILNGGLAECRQLREDISRLHHARTKSSDAEASIELAEKEIKTKEKAVSEEINTATKKRTDEIEASYDAEITKLKNRSRKVKSKKGKKKREAIKLRTLRETAENREYERQLKLEIRSVYKQEGVSCIYNTKLYYSLFQPHCVSDWFVIFLSLVVTLLVVPGILYYFVFPLAWKTSLGLMLMYFILVLLYLLLYLLIAHHTKGRNKELFSQVKRIRTELLANRSVMAKKGRKIRRDKDESAYNLDQYDNEMRDISEEIKHILEEKKNALIEFEKTAKQVLADGIREKHREEQESQQAYLLQLLEEQKTATECAKELTLLIAKQYEPYLGKDNLSLDIIDQMEERLEMGNATTIAEALKQLQETAKEGIEKTSTSSKPEEDTTE